MPSLLRSTWLSPTWTTKTAMFECCSSTSVQCPYESGYEKYMKYLCRGECSSLSWGNKDIPVKSGSTAKDQRFSLKDDTAARVFTVTITDLRSEDAGQYWCGIKRPFPKPNVYTEILETAGAPEWLPETETVKFVGCCTEETCMTESDLQNDSRMITGHPLLHQGFELLPME
uniref:Ig-like domain-containing protein n=1 Tax=Astyanax mexicanus TaxID=7994 RepID=A0A3B1K7I6_ASTMX